MQIIFIKWQIKWGCPYWMSYVGGGEGQQIGKRIHYGVALTPDHCWHHLYAHLNDSVPTDYHHESTHHGYHNQHQWCIWNKGHEIKKEVSRNKHHKYLKQMSTGTWKWQQQCWIQMLSSGVQGNHRIVLPQCLLEANKMNNKQCPNYLQWYQVTSIALEMAKVL